MNQAAAGHTYIELLLVLLALAVLSIAGVTIISGGMNYLQRLSVDGAEAAVVRELQKALQECWLRRLPGNADRPDGLELQTVPGDGDLLRLSWDMCGSAGGREEMCLERVESGWELRTGPVGGPWQRRIYRLDGPIFVEAQWEAAETVPYAGGQGRLRALRFSLPGTAGGRIRGFALLAFW
jgi:hypothetical protein